MRYIEREITSKLLSASAEFPVLFITGPRQSGKSTMLKNTFGKDFEYVSLDEKEAREFAVNDPRGFLKSFKRCAFIDDIQYAPDLISHIKGVINELPNGNGSDLNGKFILAGSRDPGVIENAKSLLGLIKVFSLLPFSVTELESAGRLPKSASEWMLKGNYPKLISSSMDHEDYYQSYIELICEKYFLATFKIHDSSKFKRFLTAIAAEAGGPLNLSRLGAEVSIDARTAAVWLSIFEEAFILFRLAPYEKNGKRYVKTPKVYFYDSGLLCALLGIKKQDELGRMRASIFESAVISETVKKYFNMKQKPRFFFWRDLDNREKEIDLIEESPSGLELTEIRASQTASMDYMKNLIRFNPPEIQKIKSKCVVYDGEDMDISGVAYKNWKSFGNVSKTESVNTTGSDRGN